MKSKPLPPVVAGFDGSPSSAAALEAAAAEALVLCLPLRIVHAYAWPVLYATLANVPYEPGEWEPSATVKAELQATADRLAQRHPGLVVRTQVMAGTGGPVLVNASNGAALVVIGGRGVGGLAGLLARSVAPHVASHAHCPVLVVRADQATPSTDGRVVVGVDGSVSSRSALRFACAWAARHGAEVEAIYAAGGSDPVIAPEWLDDWVGAAARDSSTSIRPSVAAGSPSEVLLQASRSARLLVVGSRTRGEIASLMLGSVGHDLIRRSACPVVVMHGATDKGIGSDEESGPYAGTYGPADRAAATGTWS